MFSKMMGYWYGEEQKEEHVTEPSHLPPHEEMKILLITCVDTKLSVEDKVALYLKACVKIYEKVIKGNAEIMQNWKEFMQKFIVAKACEYKLLKELKEKAAVSGYFVYVAKMKNDTNPKNVILGIGLVPEQDIDALLYA